MIDEGATDEWTDPAASARARRAALARKETRRGKPDHATLNSDRDYSEEELEFLRAMDEYKRTRGRPWPTLCEVLSVLRALGYEKPLAPACHHADVA